MDGRRHPATCPHEWADLGSAAEGPRSQICRSCGATCVRDGRGKVDEYDANYKPAPLEVPRGRNGVVRRGR